MSPIKVAGLSAPVSALDICHFTKSLAVGNEFGQVNAKFNILYFFLQLHNLLKLLAYIKSP